MVITMDHCLSPLDPSWALQGTQSQGGPTQSHPLVEMVSWPLLQMDPADKHQQVLDIPQLAKADKFCFVICKHLFNSCVRATIMNICV